MHVDQLEMVKEELLDEKTNVVVITFNNEEVGKRWKLETKTTYNTYTDINKNFYSLLGLKRSLENASNSSAMDYYGSALARGETAISALEDDDHLQMGGNIMVTRGNEADDVIVNYLHPSKSSDDRPKVKFLLDKVSKLNELR